MGDSRLVAEVVLDNSEAVTLARSTSDAIVNAILATERANEKVQKSEKDLEAALKTKLSTTKEVEAAMRQQAAAGKPLEQELAALTTLYQRLEAAMRASVKSGNGVPAALAQEATAVKARMAAVEGEISRASLAAQGASDRLASSLNAGAASALRWAAGIAAAGFTANGLKNFLSDCITEAVEAERVTALLTQALKSQGIFTEGTKNRILEYSSALQKQIGVDDEEITRVQTRLIMLGRLRGEGLERATRAVFDMVAAGQDLNASLTAVAKAANGKTEALGKMGITVTKTGDDAKDFDAVLDKLEERFGGQAVAAMETYEGSLRAMKTSFGEIKEEIGKQLIPTLQTAAHWWSEVFTAIDLSGNSFETARGQIDGAAQGLDTLQRALQSMKENGGVLGSFDLTGDQLDMIESTTGLTLSMLQNSKASTENEIAIRRAILQYTRYVEEAKAAREETERNAAANAAKADADKEAAEAIDGLTKAEKEHREAMATVERATRAWIKSELERAAITDPLRLKIVGLKTANDELTQELVEQRLAGEGLDEAKMAELVANNLLIEGIEKEIAARDRATAASDKQAEQSAKKRQADEKRAAEAAAREWEQGAQAVGTAWGEAFVQIAVDQENAGQVSKRVVAQLVNMYIQAAIRRVVAERAAAMATIHAEAAEGSSRAMAAHADIPFVGIIIGAAMAAAFVSQIMANKRFLAMAGGGELRGGIPGIDSIPILGMEGENMVDKGTNTRLKRMLDAFEAGGAIQPGGGTLQLIVQAPATVIATDAQIVEQTRKAIVPALEELRDTGHLDAILGRS